MLTIVSVSAAWRIGVSGNGGDHLLVLIPIILGAWVKKPRQHKDIADAKKQMARDAEERNLK